MYHFATQELEQAYRNAITTNSRPFNTVEGVITFPDNRTPLVIDSSNLPADAIKINKQCIDGEELMFGGVFTSELEMSLLTDLDRYAFFGATVELTFRIHIGTEDNEPVFADVPLGVFTIADADRPKGMVNIKAYDNMTLLDKSIGESIISGNIWEILQRIERDTGYQLGFTESYLSNFVNTESTYALEASSDHGIKTYRDVLKMLCQLMGCFALDDRTGYLTLKKFSTTPDLTLGDNTTGVYPWYTFVPADYVSKYIGISITSTSGTYQTLSPDPTEQGLVMTIDDAPAWDLGTYESLTERTSELFTYLHSIIYTPSSLDMPSDATFDCGDMIALNVRGGDTINTIITEIEWKFHKGMKITSDGANPFIEESILDNGSQRILNQAIAKSKLQFVHFTNPSDISIGDTQDVKIAEVEFTPTAETDAMLVATILVDADVDDIVITNTEEVQVPITVTDQQGQPAVITDLQGNPLNVSGTATNTTTYNRDGKCTATIYYKLNDIKLPNELYPYYAKDEIENGKHIITVAYPLSGLLAYQRYEFEIHLICEGGDITINANDVKASIFGQQIDLVNRFTGVIKVEEDINLINIFGQGILTLNDEGTVNVNSAQFIRVSDTLLLYNISDVSVMPIYEGTGSLQPQITLRGDFDIGTEDDNYLSAENEYRFITE